MEIVKPDVTKCLGCRKGIDFFIKRDGKLYHLDMFATSDAGASYECYNQDVVFNHLMENGDRGTYSPDAELAEFYEKQDFWWEDISRITLTIFEEDVDKINSFLIQNKDGKAFLELPNEVIEEITLQLACDKGIIIDEDVYPDLIKWEDSR